MYYSYIMRSDKTGRYYVGSTQDLEIRLEQHNLGKVSSTRNKGPWIICYSESFSSRSAAYRRELQIKSFKGGEAFKRLLGNRY